MNVESVTAAWDRAEAGAPPGWRGVREHGLQRFAATGFPTPRHEDWRFTSLAALGAFEPTLRPADGEPVHPSPGAAAGQPASADPDAPLWVVLRDGAYARAGGSDDAVRITSLAGSAGDPDVAGRIGEAAGDHDDPFTALNSAFLSDGVVIHVPAGRQGQGPVFIRHEVTPGALVHSRVQIVVGDGGSLDVVEHFEGRSACFVNPVTEVFLGAGASLHHVRIADIGDEALHFGRLAVHQGPLSHLVSRHFAIGGRVSRCRVDVTLEEGAAVDLTGLYLAGPGDLVDYYTVVDHTAPHGITREAFRGVVSGRRALPAGLSGGRGVFTGRVIVRPHAQKTDAAQSVKNLLLDDDSTCNARPWLEIHADDVRCTHGAAIGRLDDESLFYLQSRGIPRDEARRVLTYAFAAGMIVGIDHAPTRLLIELGVQAWLDRIGVA